LLLQVIDPGVPHSCSRPRLSKFPNPCHFVSFSAIPPRPPKGALHGETPPCPSAAPLLRAAWQKGGNHTSCRRFSWSRISRRRSLPTLDLGSMSRNSMWCGTLYEARVVLHHLMRS